MYSAISTENEQFCLLLFAYHNNDINKFQYYLDGILLPMVKTINEGIDHINSFYTQENNIGYIEKVMEDSLALICSKGRNEVTINGFQADLIFSHNTLNNLFDKNSDYMDICADYVMKLNAICDFCDFLLTQLIEKKNYIYNSAYANVIEIKNSMEQLCEVILNQLMQMDKLQNYALSILNKIKNVQYILYNFDNNEDY